MKAQVSRSMDTVTNKCPTKIISTRTNERKKDFLDGVKESVVVFWGFAEINIF